MNPNPAEVLAGIDGWEQASLRELEGGLGGRTWLVDAGDRRAVLKIDVPQGPATWKSRAAEATVQRRAAEAGLANAVLFSSETVLLTEYIEGSVLTRESVAEHDTLAAIGDALRTLHRMPLTGRRFDAAATARAYARAIDASEAERITACIRTVDAVPLPHDLCCCHNDLVAENIIAIPQLRFLDWEYASDNDPLFDLATVIAHHELGLDAAGYLLDTYFEGNGQRWWPQLERQMELYRALSWLWQLSRA